MTPRSRISPLTYPFFCSKANFVIKSFEYRNPIAIMARIHGDNSASALALCTFLFVYVGKKRSLKEEMPRNTEEMANLCISLWIEG